MDYIDLYQIHWPDRFVCFVSLKIWTFVYIVFEYYMFIDFLIFVPVDVQYGF